MAPRTSASFRVVALAGDLAIAVGVLYAAFFLRTHVAIPGTVSLLPVENARFTLWNIVIVAAVQALSLSFFGLYRDHERFREPLGRLLLPALFIELLTLASVYFLAQTMGETSLLRNQYQTDYFSFALIGIAVATTVASIDARNKLSIIAKVMM